MKLTNEQLIRRIEWISETKEWLEHLSVLQPKHQEWLKWATRRLRFLEKHEVA